MGRTRRFALNALSTDHYETRVECGTDRFLLYLWRNVTSDPLLLRRLNRTVHDAELRYGTI